MLENHSGFRSSDRDVLKTAFIANLGGTHFDFPCDHANSNYQINWSRQKDVTLISSSCTGANNVAFQPATFVRQYFVFNSEGRLRFDTGRETAELARSPASVIVPAGKPLHIESLANHHLLVLRLELGALKNMLQAMLGIDIPGDIEFSRSLLLDDDRQQGMRQAVLQFATDLDFWGQDMLPGARAELDNALTVRFLLCSRHNFSGKLAAAPATPSPSQLRRVADYIEANWDKPLEIETLCATFGVSARSLFRHFKQFRGCTPQDFIKSVRLKNVRAMLETGGEENVSVMAIAMKCGFHSFGHFARDYRDRYGELPSETVRRTRSCFRH